MQFHDVSYDSAQPIDGYGPGFFRIAGRVIEGPILVTADAAIAWPGPEDLDALTALAGTIDVLFYGTGGETTHPPADLRAAIEAVGIGLEPMATGPACRTYNVLVAEGRRIALAALPV